MARKIIVYGLGDQSEDGFKDSDQLDDYLRAGIFREYDGRFRFSQTKQADVIVLSREGDFRCSD